MNGGFMGKFLWVDLTTKTITEEKPDDSLYICLLYTSNLPLAFVPTRK